MPPSQRGMRPSSSVWPAQLQTRAPTSKPTRPSILPALAAQSAAQTAAVAPLLRLPSRCPGASVCLVPAHALRAHALQWRDRRAIAGCSRPAFSPQPSHKTGASPPPWLTLLCALLQSATAAPAIARAAPQIRAHLAGGSAGYVPRTSFDTTQAVAVCARTLLHAFPRTSTPSPDNPVANLPRSRSTRARLLLQERSQVPAPRVR